MTTLILIYISDNNEIELLSVKVCDATNDESSNDAH